MASQGGGVRRGTDGGVAATLAANDEQTARLQVEEGQQREKEEEGWVPVRRAEQFNGARRMVIWPAEMIRSRERDARCVAVQCNKLRESRSICVISFCTALYPA